MVTKFDILKTKQNMTLTVIKLNLHIIKQIQHPWAGGRWGGTSRAMVWVRGQYDRSLPQRASFDEEDKHLFYQPPYSTTLSSALPLVSLITLAALPLLLLLLPPLVLYFICIFSSLWDSTTTQSQNDKTTTKTFNKWG